MCRFKNYGPGPVVSGDAWRRRQSISAREVSDANAPLSPVSFQSIFKMAAGYLRLMKAD